MSLVVSESKVSREKSDDAKSPKASEADQGTISDPQSPKVGIPSSAMKKSNTLATDKILPKNGKNEPVVK